MKEERKKMDNTTFKPLISHEFPLNTTPFSFSMCDYDYALVHLYLENDVYRDYFKKAILYGRNVYLDNSLFELGAAFDWGKYLEAIKDLNPTAYVLPDVFNEARQTHNESLEFHSFAKRQKIKGIPIVVIHGKEEGELQEYYSMMSNIAKKFPEDKFMIAFPFGSQAFEDPRNDVQEALTSMGLEEYYYNSSTFRKSINRAKMIDTWAMKGIINVQLKHHLLGSFSLGEFKFYRNFTKSNLGFIYSLDTSHPVATTIEGKEYTLMPYEDMRTYKSAVKINDVFYIDPRIDMRLLKSNISFFRKVVGV